ncbi:ribonuclease P protein subunit p30 [Dermacentor andersoni]|uniref:ribonuclease P protein subunit p30 n=1 Tax=Dermacentor andersoni TaxID=34620 RepID=UPI00215557C1|nr:ribonuclease P protein subunit p30-like [Dermacentor andersoni]XP_054932542.1 ribonuclease P protein subunit p30-like [Dermacentor andersoni]XP_054932543.1 ribonuclease P protein subunit p30-like [Dermacentor andersoni]
MDLNLIVQRESEKLDKSNVIKKIKTAFQLGYDVVALNVVIGASELGSKNKIPEPPQYSLTHPDLQPLTPRNRRLRILTRLTANLTDSAESHRLFQSPVAKKYDIIAVSVTQEKMFQHLCNQGEFDIVCLPLDDRLPFVVKRTQYGAATGRGLFFEIQYAPCIRDESSLRNTIANCQTLMHAGKGKGIIITSGAWMPQELRGPNDAANLGFLYGLSECTTREAVFGNCRSVIMHAETRRKVDRAIVFSKSLDELPEKDKWLVEACKAPGVEEAAAKAAGCGDSQKRGGPPPKKKKKKGHS